MPNGFPKSVRLHEAHEFKGAFREGKRTYSKGFKVFTRKNQLPEARLGLAVSKKYLKLSVQRNRIKRLVRESFRVHKSALAGLDIVVVATALVREEGNECLRAQLETHWQQL